MVQLRVTLRSAHSYSLPLPAGVADIRLIGGGGNGSAGQGGVNGLPGAGGGGGEYAGSTPTLSAGTFTVVVGGSATDTTFAATTIVAKKGTSSSGIGSGGAGGTSGTGSTVFNGGAGANTGAGSGTSHYGGGGGGAGGQTGAGVAASNGAAGGAAGAGGTGSPAGGTGGTGQPYIATGLDGAAPGGGGGGGGGGANGTSSSSGPGAGGFGATGIAVVIFSTGAASTLTPVAGFSKTSGAITKSFSVTLTLAATFAKTRIVHKALAAVLTVVAAFTSHRAVRKTVSAALTLAATFTRRTSTHRTLPASVSPVANLSAGGGGHAFRSFTVPLTPAAVYARQIARGRTFPTSTLALLAVMARARARAGTAVLALVAGFSSSGHTRGRTFAVTLTPAAIFTRRITTFRIYTATVALVGRLSKGGGGHANMLIRVNYFTTTTYTLPLPGGVVDVRLLGGGGGGGGPLAGTGFDYQGKAGGGGGGGYGGTVGTISAGTYSVGVGAGGLGNNTGSGPAGTGGNTTFSATPSVVGRGGTGAYFSSPGGGVIFGTGGAGGAGSTFAGGAGANGTLTVAGGGGGGAGSTAAGGAGGNPTGGAGGSGDLAGASGGDGAGLGANFGGGGGGYHAGSAATLTSAARGGDGAAAIIFATSAPNLGLVSPMTRFMARKYVTALALVAAARKRVVPLPKATVLVLVVAIVQRMVGLRRRVTVGPLARVTRAARAHRTVTVTPAAALTRGVYPRRAVTLTLVAAFTKGRFFFRTGTAALMLVTKPVVQVPGKTVKVGLVLVATGRRGATRSFAASLAMAANLRLRVGKATAAALVLAAALIRRARPQRFAATVTPVAKPLAKRYQAARASVLSLPLTVAFRAGRLKFLASFAGVALARSFRKSATSRITSTSTVTPTAAVPVRGVGLVRNSKVKTTAKLTRALTPATKLAVLTLRATRTQFVVKAYNARIVVKVRLGKAFAWTLPVAVPLVVALGRVRTKAPFRATVRATATMRRQVTAFRAALAALPLVVAFSRKLDAGREFLVRNTITLVARLVKAAPRRGSSTNTATGTNDYVWKQGTAGQILSASIIDNVGNPIDLTGCTVTFVLRSLTATEPTTQLPADLIDAAGGFVAYTLTTNDTAVAGRYMIEWRWTDGAGGVGIWPANGWQEGLCAENLSTPGGARLVSLGDIKERLRIQATDRSHDARLLQLLDQLTPVVEAITGPVLPRIFVEDYDGGNYFLALRRRPIIEISEVTEWRGSVEYPLTQVASPNEGSTYSYQWDGRGRVVRRTAGGGVTTFPPGPNSVRVTYRAGYLVTPENIRGGVLDLIAIHYQTSEQGRHPVFGDSEDQAANLSGQMILGFFVPQRVRESLAPNRRRPAIY